MAKNYYEIPVTRLKFNGLDGRVLNPLRSHRIQSIGQLIDAVQNNDLEGIRNLGKIGIEKIQKILVEEGYLEEDKSITIDDTKYFTYLKNLKKNVDAFFETAECDHAQMLGWKEQNEKAKNLFCSIETYLMDINYGLLEPNEIFNKRQELLEEVREYLYS